MPKVTIEFDDGQVLSGVPYNWNVQFNYNNIVFDGSFSHYDLKQQEKVNDMAVEQWPFDELYESDLDAIRQIFTQLENVSMINGVEEVEIRVKLFGSKTWTVIGWGEAGDPAAIRFEIDENE